MRRVEGLSSEEGLSRLRFSGGGVLTSRTVVIATGAAYRRLGIANVEALQGRGVFYGAAASEAPAMRGRDVFVAGGGNSAGQTALHMAKWANRVTVLVRGQSLADSMSDYLLREIDATPNVDVCYRVRVADAIGTSHLESLALEDTATGARRSVAADALLILIGSQPRTQWLGESLARDQRGFILTGPACRATPPSTGTRACCCCRWRRACPGCSRPVTCAGDQSRGSRPRWARARSPSP